MPVYTVTFHNRFGPVRRGLRVECEGDDEAIQFAATTGSDLKVELWQGDRRVWRFEPLVRWMPRSRLRWFWKPDPTFPGPTLPDPTLPNPTLPNPTWPAARRVGEGPRPQGAKDEA